MTRFRHCTVCKDISPDSFLLKHSTRAYVHPACGFQKWGVDGFLAKLTDWQVGRISYFLLKGVGALPAVEARLSRVVPK